MRSIAPAGLHRLHAYLAIQSVTALLVGLNRRGGLTDGYLSGNEFFRWVDLLNLLALPIASLVGLVLAKRWLEARMPSGARLTTLFVLEMTFIVGVYVLGAGYGEHEVTNYLNFRFCEDAAATDRLCELIVFHDDSFSHWLFFAGFVTVNACLLGLQALTIAGERITSGDRALLVANSLLIALGIFANLAFEEIGFDLPVVALLFAAAAALWWKLGERPLFVYYTAAYGLAFVATAAYKLIA